MLRHLPPALGLAAAALIALTALAHAPMELEKSSIKAATDCVVEAALTDPNIVALYRQYRLKEVTDRIVLRSSVCDKPLRVMRLLHDQLWGAGTGREFLLGEFLYDLPRAVHEQISGVIQDSYASTSIVPPPVEEFQFPLFPWPPPAASTFYVLPDNTFDGQSTVGDAVRTILSALMHSGYVERSFFGTAAGGVALVTRLERINDDGSSLSEGERWPAGASAAWRNPYEFLHGLFFVESGFYRVIVFILQDLPFVQSTKRITREDALAWLRSGANFLPSEIAARAFSGHCTVLIYEFASEGSTVRVVESRLTAKQHLEKAGVLSFLEKVN